MWSYDSFPGYRPPPSGEEATWNGENTMPHSTKDPGAADTAHGANSQEDEGRYIATDITGKQAPNSKPPTYSGNLHQLPSALAPLLTLPHWVLWRWELV